MRKSDYLLLANVINSHVTIARHAENISQDFAHKAHYLGKIVALEDVAREFARGCKTISYSDFLRLCAV